MISNRAKKLSMFAMACAMSLIVISCKEKSVDASSGLDLPSAPYPQQNATLQSVAPTLQWTCNPIGRYEVAQKEWRDVVVWKQGSATAPLSPNPTFSRGDSLPVANVSWDDIQIWLGYLNEKEGLTSNPKKYRLPTEAEWEFAARGGINSKGYRFSGSNSYLDVGWSIGNSFGIIHAVGTKAPNELGIYDMSGNVYEWCNDYYGPYTASPQTNPTGPSSGSVRIERGGCIASDGNDLSNFYRDYDAPDTRRIFNISGNPMNDWLGFRYARTQ